MLSSENQFKKILYFHNDPLNMQGSSSKDSRINLYKKCDLIIFNSNWTKNRFLNDLPQNYNSSKLSVIPQSTSKTYVNFKSKKKNNFFYWKIK